jgi:hypothetical protein
VILAHYDIDFHPLSTRHEDLIRKADELLDTYCHEQPLHPTYAVIGTFGAGKTQFLYYLARKAIERGLLPLLFLAEDLFSEVVRGSKVFTQGDVAALVENKMNEAIAALSVGSTSNEVRESLNTVLDPRGNNSRFVDELVRKYAGKPIQHSRVVLLVDELEGQYRTLQERVQTPGDRSPLRELFEARVLFQMPYLKFFALAPAGIYEMGGADQTRALRLVIPAADVTYIRSKSILSPGRANACWWLSRGKARHLFKACTALQNVPANPSAPQVARLIRDELDQIGQSPTEVPPAVTEGLPATKLTSLIDIAPIPTSPRRCYHIELLSFNEGQMAECL